MGRTTILLEDDLLLEIKQIARAQGTTFTEVIRQAVRNHIECQTRTRTLSFTSVGRSGRRSVSSKAEEILRQRARKAEGW
jgi:hypothetical protein